MSCYWETELDFPLRKPKRRAPLLHTPPLVSQGTDKWLRFWKLDSPNQDCETWNQLSKNEGMIRKHYRYLANTAIAYASSLGFWPFQSWSLSLLLILEIPNFLPIISFFTYGRHSLTLLLETKSHHWYEMVRRNQSSDSCCSVILLQWGQSPHQPGF